MEINIPTAAELRERLNSEANIAVQEQFKEVQLKLNLAVKNNSSQIHTEALLKPVKDELKRLGYKVEEFSKPCGEPTTYKISW